MLNGIGVTVRHPGGRRSEESGEWRQQREACCCNERKGFWNGGDFMKFMKFGRMVFNVSPLLSSLDILHFSKIHVTENALGRGLRGHKETTG